jgi:hypothetical protein
MQRRATTTGAHGGSGARPQANPASNYNVPWSAKEDDVLIKAKRRLGNKWTEIANYQP